MSGKKSTTAATDTENNENLCPQKRISRKRTKPPTTADSKTPTQHSEWKLARLAASTSSSPLLETITAETKEYLAEMGIGMLESSEESCSSSSVTSGTLALAVSNTSADENSNEATPNLDAPKFCHQQHQQQLQQQRYRRSTDNSLSLDDSTSTTASDNANNSFIDPNEALKSGYQLQQSINRSAYNIKECYDNFQSVADKMPTKILAIIGVDGDLQWINNSSPSNIPAANIAAAALMTMSTKTTRSPLVAVRVNTLPCNANNIHPNEQQQPNQQQQQIQQQNQQQQPNQQQQQPSTSRQAALQRQEQQQQEQPVEVAAPTSFVPPVNFFLYRNAQALREQQPDSGFGVDRFHNISDEIILHIFQWLPKKALLRCGTVSRQFSRCARDESLWTRLDLGGRALRASALENVLTRGVVVLRLAQTQLHHPVLSREFEEFEANFMFKVQYLDLSMATVTKPSLKMLLSHCRQLKKLSLEHVPLNNEICVEIAQNTKMEALNLAMCSGLESWTIRHMFTKLQNLNSLNISWTMLTPDAVSALVATVTPNLMRLNVAGCRKTMFDLHLCTLIKRCTQLLELDLSDCTGLTGNAVTILCNSKMLEYLSISRCYLIPGLQIIDLTKLPALKYLDIFGSLSEPAMENLERSVPELGINKFIHSSVARPTVGTRRTSIWGLRTRD